jgi:hypothetical protein
MGGLSDLLPAEIQVEDHRAEPALQLCGGAGVGYPPGGDDHYLIG